MPVIEGTDGPMSTRAISSDYAQAAAALVGLVRSRPNDAVDPFPPASEFEVLADAGARGKEAEVHPRIALEGKDLVGFGAVDLADGHKVAMLVGPLIHPAHRRKGHGKMLLDDLIGQARTAKHKRVRACVGSDNGAGRAFLKAAGFRLKEMHTRLRLELPFEVTRPAVKGVSVRRANYDHSAEVHEYCAKFIPRNAKQTRSLLKTRNYAIFVAYQKDRIVAHAELDMRYGATATVEFMEGKASLLGKAGLGNLFLAEMIECASEAREIDHLDLLVHGNDAGQIAAYREAGFQVRQEAHYYERSV